MEAPVATTSSSSDVGESNIGETSYSFTVTYTDDSAVDVDGTVDINDVTVTGPGGPLTVTGAVPDVATDGTPRTVTYTVTPPGGSWDAADNGSYTIAIAGNEVGDDDATQLFVAADAGFASFNVNATNTDPIVSNSLAEDVIVTDFGETSYTFTIEYSDVGGISPPSFDVNDITVTGPGGPLTVTTALGAGQADGSPRTATYTVTPPGGSWDAADAGTYTIGMVGGQVLDVLGASVAADPSLISFDVHDNKLLNETFETDGNGSRYSTSGEFVSSVNDYFSRITDTNGNTAGGETPAIDLDDLTVDEYTDFQGQTYFAAEDLTAGGGGATFRVIDLNPINTASYTSLQFMGLFGAGDNTDGNPVYDGDHFMAVLLSTDA